uniref:POTRA domain-containing protein n=1 Tax=Betaphycus gelatinus TaxID=1191690 RepID=A0A8E7PFZ4_9FLOR|nr:hypothetical protein [Betaphycus gelatinus]
MLYRLKYLPLFIFLTIYLVFLEKKINTNICIYTKIAFNINITDNGKLRTIHKQNIQVQLEGYKNILFFNILPKYYKILHEYDHYYIKALKLIKYLQNSGFLNKIEYFIIYSNNIVHFIVNINTNPIIKKIEIIKYNQLKIPQQILIHFFKSQIGLPANYKYINNSIKKIYQWYQEQGFEYIYIQLIGNQKNHTIKLHIFEGKIKSNKFICCSKHNISRTLVHKIEKIIERKLNILPGSLLNIKILQENIKYLKNIRLIKNLKYDIIYDLEGLIVKINYSIPTQSQGYFYNKYLVLNSYVNQIKSYTINKNVIKNKYLVIFENIKNNFNHKLYYRYLGFKTFFPNVNSKYYNSTVTIILTRKLPQLKINFFYPNLELAQDILDYIKINIYYRIYYIKTLYPFQDIQAKYFSKQNKLQPKTLFHSIKTDISCKYIVNNEIYIMKNIKNICNTHTKKFINLNSYFINQYIVSRAKVLNTIIQQKLFSLNLQIKYNNPDLHNKFRSGIFIFIDSIFFKFTKFQNINAIYNRSSMRYYQTFTIKNLLPYIKKSIIIIFSEVSLLNNINTIIFHKYSINSVNIYLELFNKETIKTYIQYLNHVEYHIQINDFLSTYFFYHISNKLHYIYTYYYYTQNLGLGIQFNIPINNIPKIRFEYGINIYAQNYYQLRLFYPYIT